MEWGWERAEEEIEKEERAKGSTETEEPVFQWFRDVVSANYALLGVMGEEEEAN